MFRFRLSISLIAVLFCLAPFAGGQTLPFSMRVQQASTVANVSDGGTVAISADAIGVPAVATLTVTYTGSTFATINSVDLTGSTDYALSSGLPEFPFTLRANQSLVLSIRFTPSTSARTAGQIAFGWSEGKTGGKFGVGLSGVAPEFAFSYIPEGGNASLLSPDGTVTFPLTDINDTSTAVVVLTNRGTGPGVVGSVSLSGAAFQLAGVPLPGTSVDAGKDVRFTIQFTPKQLEVSLGALTVGFVNRSVSFKLEGPGSGPLFTYEVVQDSGVTPVVVNQALTVPDAVVGEKSTMVVRVKNSGNAEGTISDISVLGAGFTLTDLPFLPLTMQVGNSIAFTIMFQPAQPGRVSGRLRIGNDMFDVVGGGLGPRVTYSYVIGDTTTAVLNNGSVFFTPTSVGKTATVRFLITNTGTAPTTVNSISVVTTSPVFTLADVPALPLTLAAGATAPFTIQFAPKVVGTATATLNVDSQTFTLSGSAGAPDPLPGFKFEAPSGPQEPMQQPAIGLSLASPYPLTLSGTLTLTFNSEAFSNDPAVQFAIGGRTVNFTIPANTTEAIFPQNQNRIKVQTGTVAGTITITPSFATDAGIDLTPVNPPSLSLVVPQSAPRLLGVEVSAKTGNGFTLLVRGYATSRSVTQMDFQFTPAPNETVSTTKVSLNVEANFLSWFQGTTSQQYGSLFTATVPFTLAGDVNKVSQIVDTIQSVSVTLANRQGTSGAQSVSLR